MNNTCQYGLPNVTFHPAKYVKSYYGVIEEDGKDIHHVADIDAYYSVFGYTREMRKSGILPEEFIWETYIRKNCLRCLKMHMIEYLMRNSESFREKYQEQYQQWLENYRKEKDTANCARKCLECAVRPCDTSLS